MKILQLTLISYLLLVCLSCGKGTITTESLLNEMVDREALARFPDPAYTCAQFSSYDRATVAPDHDGWFANWDRSMFIRTEEHAGKKEYVMMDTTGPGAIVRFWMTFAGDDCGKGTLRVYIDHDTIPVLEGGAMELLSGGKLVESPLASSVSDSTAYEMRGHNLYLPIPYAKHCKVTYQSDHIKDAGAKTGGEAVYYNINYRTYESGTKVVSFSADQLQKSNETLEKVQQKLKGFDRTWVGKTNISPINGTMKPNDSIVVRMQGAKAIRRISLKPKAKNLPQALRSTLLTIRYDSSDNQSKPSVACPLGDFFGTGYQLRPVQTWYTEVTAQGQLSAWWVMPFREDAIVCIHNLGEQTVELEGEVEATDWSWDKRSMYFGAHWQEYHQLATGEMKNNEGHGELGGDPFDINYVQLAGKGVYVGDAITIFNTVYAWWGEGDEKIYVDGESFPSHIGTGTEDYYGYAWCRPEKITNHPFIAQPDGSGNFWPGYTVNSRYRSLDAIPFTSSLVFDMEMWHWTRASINFAPVSFYYLQGNRTLKVMEPSNAQKNKTRQVGQALNSMAVKQSVATKRSDIVSPELVYIAALKQGSMEAEDMVVEKFTGGNFRYQNTSKYGWSGNMQAYWSKAQVGDQLQLSFLSPIQGNVPVTAVFTTGPEYGKFRFSLDGASSIVVDLYAKDVARKSFDLGLVKFHEGEINIKVDVVGAAPNEKQTTVFGFDELRMGAFQL